MSNNDNGPRGTIFDKIYPKGSTLSSLSRQNNQSEESINSDTSTSKSNWTPQPPPPLSTSSSGVGPGYSTSSLYSSVKRLNLFPKRLADTDSGVIYNSNSFKRFRNNNNIDNLSDSVNEPSARSRVSHVSTPSSTSSVAFGYLTGEFGRKRYPRTPLSVTGRDSPSLIMNSLNLSSSASNSGRNAMPMNQNRKPTTGSYFYTGKTTFGGSNLRKNIHRLSMTPYSPYSRVNVKCIEPTAVQRPPSATGKSISHSTINEELPLSSVTQRILDRLDKAAAPISDAKSRIPISTLISNSAKKFDISRTPKLFDTPTPIIENRDRSHIDSNFKPMKYILKPSSSFNDETSTVMAGDKSIDDDIQKLNQIKQAEKELKEQQEKVQTKTFVEPTLRTMKNFAQSSLSTSSGKITARDVKKGRKIDDVLEMDDSHLKSLANVQPLATMTTGITLKPFSLNSSTPMNHSDKSNTFDIRSTCDKTNVPNCSTINNEFSFKFSSPKLVASLSPMAVRPTFQEIDFSSPIQISESKPIVQSVSSTPTTTKSLFDQFKHRIQSTDSWTCQICCTQNDDINADKCIACEEHNPHKKSSKNNDSTSSTVAQKPETIKFGDCNKLAQNPSFSSSLPSLNHLFKKDTSKNWTCPTCSVSNNIEENRCISCEEPNPHSNAKTSTSNNQMNNLTKFSFGSISTGINSDTSSSTDNSSTITKQPSLFDVIQKKKTQDKQQWTCPTCMVPNESNVDRCVSCEEPNPNQPVANQTKSSNASSFGFKFGISNTDSNNSCQKDHSTTIAEEWQCFYCKALNKSDDISKNVCNECGKIKVMAATKDQVQKFYQTQTFKFGLSTGVTNKDVKTVETKSEKQDKTSNDITTSSSTSGGFKFGAPSSCNVSNSPTMTSPFASSKTAVPFLSFGSSPSLSSSLVKPIESKTEKSSSLFSFGTTTNSAIDAPSLEKTTKPNTGTTPTASVSSSSSNLFVFGDNSSKSGTTANNNEKESLNEDNNNKTITPFGFNAISSTSSTNIKPPMATGLFSFGGAKPLDSSKPSLSSSFSKDTSTSSSFTFGGAVTSTTNISTSTTTTKSTSGTLFGKELNFGSPITVPKIDSGPPIPKITISFAQPGTATSSTTTAGSVGQSSTSNTLFTFGSSPNITLSANPTPTAPVFGSNSLPSSFNFMGTNTTNNNNGPMGTSSLFTFGAKPNNEPQPSIDKPASVGFNFGAPSNPLSFGGAGVSSNNNPVMPSFNTTTSSGLFKFGSQEPASNLSFQSFPNSAVEGNNNLSFPTSLLDPQQQQPDMQQQPTGIFQFQSSNAANMQQRPNPASRAIKKAKRRLK